MKSDHYLTLCLTQAALSPLHHRHGSILVRGGKVLGAGHNAHRRGYDGSGGRRRPARKPKPKPKPGRDQPPASAPVEEMHASMTPGAAVQPPKAWRGLRAVRDRALVGADLYVARLGNSTLPTSLPPSSSAKRGRRARKAAMAEAATVVASREEEEEEEEEEELSTGSLHEELIFWNTVRQIAKRRPSF
ncbi:cytidine and deoxycytidylate deaminase [Neofusicoccum parvum]|nr:cytidine and deoxycytidylate deaminase [Neofusicoccum parvum]